MIVWIVKIIHNCSFGTSDDVDVWGVYSNLALAGRAAMQALKKYSDENDDDIITFNYHVEPWGYYFEILAGSDKWLHSEMEIVRMVVNE